MTKKLSLTFKSRAPLAVNNLILLRFSQLKHVALLGLILFFSCLGGCIPKNYGDEFFRLSLAAHGKDVMWFPTKIAAAHEMLSAAGVGADDVVYDLGSGDGVLPIQAAKLYGSRSVGIEFNPDLVALSKRNAQRAAVSDLAIFRQGDIFIEDFSEATVVTLYLGETLNERLIPKILNLRPGTRVVSNTFGMRAWEPDRKFQLSTGEQAYLWIVPAQLDGSWIINGIPGVENARLKIRQKKQRFDGVFEGSGFYPIYFESGLIVGNTIHFEFVNRDKVSYTVRATFIDSRILGSVSDGKILSQLEGNRPAVNSIKQQ
jgi:predicted RNA methylase